MLLTYDRDEYAHRTLAAVFGHLTYPEPYRIHIADDGSPPEYVESLASFARTRGRDIGTVISSTNSMRKGYGASYNLATQTVHASADIVLVLEDDWELQRELDVVRLTRAFEIDGVGCVRLGYIGYTQALRGAFVDINGDKYLEFDPSSPERHVFAGHPRLETVRWQRQVGPWTEGLDPGATEFDTAGKEGARKGVVWPLDLVATRGDMFHHIGTVQARTDQREAS
jgi:hypothetical protein